jgi:hypothetical protein
MVFLVIVGGFLDFFGETEESVEVEFRLVDLDLVAGMEGLVELELMLDVQHGFFRVLPGFRFAY